MTDLMSINVGEVKANEFTQVYCTELGPLPLKYLGVPPHYNKLRKEDIQTINDEIILKKCG